MERIVTFKDIKAWQKAHILALYVYKITEGFPRSEEFGLKSQMRRCAISVPSNIAEGFKRKSKNDSLRFYNISEASLEEIKYQLMFSKDFDLLSNDTYNTATDKCEETGKTLNGWIKSQR